MKPIIYFLDDKSGHGKPTLIRALTERLEESIHYTKTIYYPSDLLQDTVCVLEVGGLRIGLMSHEDPSHSPGTLLNFFSNKGCQILFCTSIQPNNLNKAIASLVSNGVVQSVYLKSIWSPQFEMESLKQYELNKLVEIIELHTEKDVLQSHEINRAPEQQIA